MIEFVDNVLKPYIEMAPKNVVPLLVLDSYQCHTMTSAIEAIQKLHVEVEHIPDGCTSFCQPVDIGINKALKMLVYKHWEDWILDSGINESVVKPPIQQLIVGWVCKAFDTISVDMFNILGGMEFILDLINYINGIFICATNIFE